MTRYSEGSPIFVPVSVTNSAVMPWSRPIALTRSRKAGGNEYSRPQSSPTFIRFRGASPRRTPQHTRSRGPLRSPRRACGSLRSLSCDPLVSRARFVDEPADDRAKVARFPVHLELPIGAGALGEDGVDVVERLAAAELVDHVVHELEQFDRQLAHRHLAALAEVDEQAV